MDDAAAVFEGLGANLDFVGPDCLEIPHLVVVYLRSAETMAALIPTPAFLEDLDRRRRAVAHFVRTLDEAPRESLKAALIAAEVDVSDWWGAEAKTPQAQQVAGA